MCGFLYMEFTFIILSANFQPLFYNKNALYCNTIFIHAPDTLQFT